MNKLQQNEGLEAAGIEQMWPWDCAWGRFVLLELLGSR